MYGKQVMMCVCVCVCVCGVELYFAVEVLYVRQGWLYCVYVVGSVWLVVDCVCVFCCSQNWSLNV